MNFKPLHDRVLVKPDVQESKTAKGIIIPDTAKEKPLRGKVVAVGSGMRDKNNNLIPLEIKLGDVVLYGKWGGTDVNIGGEDLIIIKESDILGILG
ncbi:co-chaperone GroES [Rickettsia endosymbiont of Cardiosporidium cionae]|uniref:co-chaperone GroES n=1 Tax=Rickettsia endosymbiont of Cardiosporidium cionae TaxID=2777155 RepID=UPI001893751F|nr:co-chaperone GroES [Rickettsia endosymbiont of Cardiosporidium cionae]KAF8818548.1 molecular chaperone GroES [Rickettsia endosymbiont of Cardiosporidium cionae]